MSRIADVARTVNASGLAVRSINGDIGDLNLELNADERAARNDHLDILLTLAAECVSKTTIESCPWWMSASARARTPRTRMSP